MVVMGNPPYSGFSQNKNYLENKVYKVNQGVKKNLMKENIGLMMITLNLYVLLKA